MSSLRQWPPNLAAHHYPNREPAARGSGVQTREHLCRWGWVQFYATARAKNQGTHAYRQGTQKIVKSLQNYVQKNQYLHVAVESPLEVFFCYVNTFATSATFPGG